MYRPARRPRAVHLGQSPAQRSPWPMIAVGVIGLTLAVGAIGYLSARTAKMQRRSRAARRWG